MRVPLLFFFFFFFLFFAALATLRHLQTTGRFIDTTPLEVGLKKFQTSQILVPLAGAVADSRAASCVHDGDGDDMSAVVEPIQVDRDCVVSIPRMKPLETETATAEYIHKLLDAAYFDVLAIEVRFVASHATSNTIASARVAFGSADSAKNAAAFLRSVSEFPDTHVSTCESHPFHVRVLERVGTAFVCLVQFDFDDDDDDGGVYCSHEYT